MMILWIVGAGLAVSVPVLVGLLKGILDAARKIDQTVEAIAGVAAAASKDLDAVVVLVTTQSYISQVVDGLANYGGSLDVALPNA
jgi:hypothetical protein